MSCSTVIKLIFLKMINLNIRIFIAKIHPLYQLFKIHLTRIHQNDFLNRSGLMVQTIQQLKQGFIRLIKRNDHIYLTHHQLPKYLSVSDFIFSLYSFTVSLTS